MSRVPRNTPSLSSIVQSHGADGTRSDFRAVWGGTETLPAEVLEVCRAILSGAPIPGLEGLREERGKRTFRAEIFSGAASGKFVVKEFGPRGPLDALFLRHLRPGPGRRYPHAAAAIREAGVSTPGVRFVASYDGPDGPRDLIGAEQLEETRMLGDVLAGLSAQQRAGLFQIVGQIVARLHRAGIFHFDLNADNLLFCAVGGCLTGPHLVDLDHTVRTPVRRRWLCRVLARLDLHQFFTAGSIELTKEDRHMFEKGYRCGEGHAQRADRTVIHLASGRVRPERKRDAVRAGDEEMVLDAVAVSPSNTGPLPQHRYPLWKRRAGTNLIHLFRGALLVCRLVQ